MLPKREYSRSLEAQAPIYWRNHGSNSRPLALDPYQALPELPVFTLTSADMTAGGQMPTAQIATGENLSPQLSWRGFPKETQSFLLTCFDPDAPTPSGFWHWLITDIPAEMTSLPTGAGSSDLELDGPAFHLRNDGGGWSYMGGSAEGGSSAPLYFCGSRLGYGNFGPGRGRLGGGC